MTLSDTQLSMIEEAKSLGFSYELLEDERFNSDQLDEILRGLKAGIDVKKYAIPTINWRIMNVMRRGLVAKVDVSVFLTTTMSYDEAEALLQTMINELAITKESESGYPEYFDEVKLALESKTDFHITKAFHGDMIKRYFDEGKSVDRAVFSFIAEIEKCNK
jgi:hypothetical protein